jgi:hypothetical protein
MTSRLTCFVSFKPAMKPRADNSHNHNTVFKCYTVLCNITFRQFVCVCVCVCVCVGVWSFSCNIKREETKRTEEFYNTKNYKLSRPKFKQIYWNLSTHFDFGQNRTLTITLWFSVSWHRSTSRPGGQVTNQRRQVQFSSRGHWVLRKMGGEGGLDHAWGAILSEIERADQHKHREWRRIGRKWTRKC